MRMQSLNNSPESPQISRNLQGFPQANSNQNKNGLEQSDVKIKKMLFFDEVISEPALTCCFSRKIMENPIQLIPCGHHMEEKIFRAWRKQNLNDGFCPQCQNKVTRAVEGVFMKNIIEKWWEAQGRKPITTYSLFEEKIGLLIEHSSQYHSDLSAAMCVLPEASQDPAVHAILKLFNSYFIENKYFEKSNEKKVLQNNKRPIEEIIVVDDKDSPVSKPKRRRIDPQPQPTTIKPKKKKAEKPLLLESSQTTQIPDSTTTETKKKTKRNSLHQYASNGHGKSRPKINLAIEKLLKNHPEFLNAQDEYGDTPLHLAAKGDLAMNVRKLIECKADITIVNQEGKTPVQLAVKTQKFFPKKSSTASDSDSDTIYMDL
jgi:Ankyrin repeats (many copies)